MLSAFLVARANESNRSGEPPRTSTTAGAPPPAAGARERGGVSAPRAQGGGGGKGLLRSAAVAAASAGGSGGDPAGGGAGRDTDSLESLAAFVAAGEGSRWRSDWPEEDRAAFRKGIFAFRRDFHRVRAAFLPHKAYGDVVEYFYRCERE